MKIHEQAKHYKALADARAKALESILQYVCSDKFNSDNMVNTMDIILRVREQQMAITEEFGE